MVGLSLDKLELEMSLLFGVQQHSVLGHLGYDRGHLDDLVTLLERDLERVQRQGWASDNEEAEVGVRCSCVRTQDACSEGVSSCAR